MNSLALDSLRQKIEQRFQVSLARDYKFPLLPRQKLSTNTSLELSLGKITQYDLHSQNWKKKEKELNQQSSSLFRPAHVVTQANDSQRSQLSLKTEGKFQPPWLKNQMQSRIKTDKQPQMMIASQSPQLNLNKLKKNVSDYQLNTNQSMKAEISQTSRVQQSQIMTGRPKGALDATFYRSGVNELKDMLKIQQAEQTQAYFMKSPRTPRPVLSKLNPQKAPVIPSPRNISNFKKLAVGYNSQERSKPVQQSLSPRIENSNSQLYYNSNVSKYQNQQSPYGVAQAINNFRRQFIKRV